MMRVMRRLILFFLFLLVAAAQSDRPGFPPIRDKDEDVKLPDGTSQRQAILKADHKKSVADAKRLAELSAEVQSDLEKGDANLVSLKTIKQLDEIERLAKAIRGRLKRI
jgi:hypothetical protein